MVPGVGESAHVGKHIVAIQELVGEPAGGRLVGHLQVRRPFHREPEFGVTSVNYDLAELLARAGAP